MILGDKLLSVGDIVDDVAIRYLTPLSLVAWDEDGPHYRSSASKSNPYTVFYQDMEALCRDWKVVVRDFNTTARRTLTEYGLR